jgi:hypothetical protein
MGRLTFEKGDREGFRLPRNQQKLEDFLTSPQKADMLISVLLPWEAPL